MIRLNIHEAKTHLSRYLDQIDKSGGILLCKRNVPVAEVRAITQKESDPRPVGLEKGRFEVDATFFDALPDDVLDGFANPQ